MRKNDLIKLLQSLEGNPEIVMWNGFVGDYQNISTKLVEGDLVKQTLEDHLLRCRHERATNKKDWGYQLTQEEESKAKESYKEFGYEINPYVTEEDIKEGRYRRKKVVYIKPKISNRKYQDCLGSIEY